MPESLFSIFNKVAGLKHLFNRTPLDDGFCNRFFFQNAFVMKMNCSILESCFAFVTKHESSKGTPKLTFILIKILLMSLKLINNWLQNDVEIEAATGGVL